MKLPVLLPLLALAFAPSLAVAQEAQTGSPPNKVKELIIYGNDSCPKAEGGEIVVCKRQPESERYRLPRRFRDADAKPAQQSWTNTTAAIEAASRKAAGLPDSCSPIGSGGQSGCQRQFLNQAAAERRQQQDSSAGVP